MMSGWQSVSVTSLSCISRMPAVQTLLSQFHDFGCPTCVTSCSAACIAFWMQILQCYPIFPHLHDKSDSCQVFMLGRC